MKRTKKIAAFLILFLCASMLLVLPTSAKSRKKYDLKVSDVKVSSKNLKPGDKCKISMKIVNRGYGKMKNVYVCYDSPSTQVYYVPLQVFLHNLKKAFLRLSAFPSEMLSP